MRAIVTHGFQPRLISRLVSRTLADPTEHGFGSCVVLQLGEAVLAGDPHAAGLEAVPDWIEDAHGVMVCSTQVSISDQTPGAGANNCSGAKHVMKHALQW